MRYFATFLMLTAATCVVSLPLNINLGAYSPALVVGDGEISFGGAESAAALVNTLQGAATGTTAAAATAKLAAAIDSEKTTSTDGSVVITPATGTAAEEAALPIAGMGKSVAAREPDVDSPSVVKRTIDERDLNSFNAALAFATGAITTSPGVELGTGEGGSGVGITVKPGGKVTRDVRSSSFAAESEGNGPTGTLLKIRTIGSEGSQSPA